MEMKLNRIVLGSLALVLVVFFFLKYWRVTKTSETDDKSMHANSTSEEIRMIWNRYICMQINNNNLKWCKFNAVTFHFPVACQDIFACIFSPLSHTRSGFDETSVRCACTIARTHSTHIPKAPTSTCKSSSSIAAGILLSLPLSLSPLQPKQ